MEKVENMLSQLIKMVCSTQSDQQEMNLGQQEIQSNIQDLQSKIQEIESKIQDIEIKGEERHKEILSHFKSLENDQDFIWEKTARNERKIGNIKRQLS